MDTQIVQEELDRRARLVEQIDYIIIEDYRNAPKKFKRGPVHRNIAKKLEMTLNNFLARLIIIRMLRHGFRCRTHNGTQYFVATKRDLF